MALTRFALRTKFLSETNIGGSNTILKNLTQQCTNTLPKTLFNRSRTYSSSNSLRKHVRTSPFLINNASSNLLSNASRLGVIYCSRGLITEPGMVVPTLHRGMRDQMVDQMKSYYRDNYIANYNKELLNDIPSWLDGMGLKGLAPYFEGKNWEEIIELTSWEQLQDLGIMRPPHRKRLIRNFWILKRFLANEQGIELEEQARDSAHPIPEHNDKVDFVSLEDLPTMLNGIYDGFGYFAPHFEGRNWKEIIGMNWEDLEVLGIRSRAVRSRMIGFFWSVKRALAAENGEPIPKKTRRLGIFQRYDSFRHKNLLHDNNQV
ncbi:12746_t:CDS:2 [Acaulospora morrowiae]|uniref:12746_t:CDS:1 n=1 Tax=Acaulospora morrowiae TaxID=94023 RepID=A0A9N8W015_9GLOM|nr:12746_t:CDS:2 [Acaulospora morrowiae]